MPAASSIQERTQQVMDMIMQAPEQPQMAQIKSDIIKSDTFSNFKVRMGYEGMDDALVFKEMSRVYRVKAGDDRKEFRHRRKETIRKGLAPARVGGSSEGTIVDTKKNRNVLSAPPPDAVAGSD